MQANDGCTFDPAAPPACSRTADLGEVLARQARQARWGECDTGRYRCRYYEWGRGKPLIFIPGMGDDAQSFVLPISRLTERFRCIAYDLPNGRDDGAQLSSYRHEDHIDDLLVLCRHLGLDRTDLFGSSFGSTIALAALHRQPDRFGRCLLQGGFAQRPLAPAEVLLASFARWWPWDMRWLPLRNETLHHEHHQAFAHKPPAVWDFYLDRSGAIPMAALARRALILHRLDLRPILPDIIQPVLLVCGDQDPLVGRACEQDLLHGLPHVLRAEIEDCGHFPQFTHPEVLAEIAGRFLDGVWQPGSKHPDEALD